MNLKRIICATSWFMAMTVMVTAQTWSDVTNRFITNPAFNDNSNAGWTWESNASTQEVRVNCISFYNGAFDLHQQLKGLPRGTYRISVQGFYRTTDNNSAYNAYKNGTEDITAYLYAGQNTQKLTSLYSASLDYNAASRCYTPDNLHYYPDGKEASLAAFAEGLYVNTLEFEANGDVLIGVKTSENKSNNYCVLDNFKLEYKSPIGPDGKAWIDITSEVLQNPTFDNNSQAGWQWESQASSQAASEECMEFWNGTFNIHQDVSYGQNGKYRLSVQAFYRVGDNDNGYQNYQNGTEDIPAVMYAGDTQQKLVSVFSEPSDEWIDGSWNASWNGPYFPDRMWAARVWFDNGKYWNSMEFESDGNFRIGLMTDSYQGNNWCIFDNFKLEYYGDCTRVSDISVNAKNTSLVVGETTQAVAIVSPADATIIDVEWLSSDENVATVSANGLITAHKEGTAKITARAMDGSDTEGSIVITVIHNPAKAGSLIINEVMASNIDEMISPAFNFDGWMELYNPTDKPVELGGIKLSNGEGESWTVSNDMGAVPAKGYFTVWFDSNDLNQHHVPFKLDVDGGTISLNTSTGAVIDQLTYPTSLERISYARSSDGTGQWGYTDTPTQGASNNGIKIMTQQISAPVVDQPSQLFMGSINVNVTIPSGCTLRYTTDGTLPTLNNGMTSYSGQFQVNYTSVFRFRLYADDMLPSRVTTRSYIERDRDYYLPVVSVVTDPTFLYSKEIGVMEKGPNGRPGNGQSANCNWNMNWERPVNFSYLDENGDMVLNQDVNLEMCGGWSRAFTPHSFKLKGDKEMGGDKNLPYPFFTQKPYIRNRTLQIRNGGNDTSCRFKDASLTYLVQTSGIDVDVQSYQPVHEFINGQYIGVLNMREPNNKHYVYANYGWDDDEIDQWEMSPDSGYVQKCGTPEAYEELVDELSPNAADANTYKEICNLLDIDEFTNYMAIQFYYGGSDWPRNNVKCFRNRDNGKFRFVMFDVDAAFDYGTDAFQQFMWKEWWTFDELYPRGTGRIRDHIRLVTLFKNLIQNESYRRKFIDTYCIVAGSVFEWDRVNQILQNLYNRVEPAMNLNGGSAYSSYNNVRNNLSGRLNNAITAIKNYGDFGLNNATPRSVALKSQLEGAVITINGIELPTGSFNGKLFNTPVINATAPAGYSFKAWVKDDGTNYSSRADIPLPDSDIKLTATFNQLSATSKQKQGITPVRINEVSGSNNSLVDEYFKKGDWIELYNTTDEAIDVEGMYLTDNLEKPTKYQISKNGTNVQTIIPAHGYLIVWCDNKRATTDQGLHATFKIDGDGGQLALMAADKSWTDTFVYPAHDANTTVGRYPDGTSKVYTMNVATIAHANRLSSYMTKVDQTIINGIEKPVIASANGLRAIYGNKQVIVKSEEDGPVMVSIYNASGMLVEQTSAIIKGGRARIDVSHLDTGLYVARAINESGTSVSCKFRK